MDALAILLRSPSPYLRLAGTRATSPLDALAERVDAWLAAETPRFLFTSERAAHADREAIAAVLKARPVAVAGTTAADLLLAIDATIPHECDDVLVVDGHGPLVSPALGTYLQRLHRRTVCDYTFADGYPRGYAPEVLRREIVTVLAELARGRDVAWTPTVLFDAISIDINAFDIETEAAPEDWALLRAPLTVDSRPDYLRCRRLLDEGAPIDVHDPGDPLEARFDPNDATLERVAREPSLRRTGPRFLYVEVTDRYPQRPFWSAWGEGAPLTPGRGERDIDVAAWKRIVERVTGEWPEIVIGMGYRGDPGLHPQLATLLETTGELAPGGWYLETSGLGWSTDARDALARCATRPAWSDSGALIVELDASHGDLYRRVRGEGYEEAIAFVEWAASILPGRVFAQATRMDETEEDLQRFFERWTAVEGVQPLIQKYNGYAGRLVDRRVASLEPLERTACRHLERDLVVWYDGSVVRCHQDLDGEVRRGNVLTDAIDGIWAAGLIEYGEHDAGTFSSLCAACDEYYTVNA